MELEALKIAGIITFGAVGAYVAGKAVAQVVANNGGSEREQLASACLAGGLCAAVLPAAVVGGVLVTGHKVIEISKSDSFKASVASAKAQTLGTMNKVVNPPKPRAKRA